MTAKSRLMMNLREILGELIYGGKNEAEWERIAENAAFEKEKATKLLRGRTDASETIQKHWRGYTGRLIFKDSLLKHFRQLSLIHYNSMATKIQRVWRGHWIRQHVYNYYKRKDYFQALAEKNSKILTQVQEFQEKTQKVKFAMAEALQIQHRTEVVRKYHHLVSTQRIPGVYNNPYRPDDRRDTCLKSAKFERIPYSKKKKQFDNRAEKLLESVKNRPSVQPKQQGPFLDPKEVQLQRYKPIRETLAMETDFYHLEKARKKMKDYEWTQRHQNQLFLPVISRDPRYKASIQSLSVYVPLEKVCHREEEDPSLNVDKEKNFRVGLTTIPLFDVFSDKMEEMKWKKLIKLT